MSYYTKLNPNGIVEALVIDESTTEGAVEMLRKLISVDVIKPKQFYKAYVDYNCQCGLDPNPHNVEKHFALKFKGKTQNAPLLLVSPITAGYGGSGPTACFQCLKLMGFIHGDMDDHPEIFQKRTFLNNGHICEDPVVHLTYSK